MKQEEMENQPRLYNSRIMKTYVEYLSYKYPRVDVDLILSQAGMTMYEVQDPAHWFTQEQVDLFQKAIVQATANPEIAREAGQYTTSSEGLGALREYALGFVNPGVAYRLLGKIYSRVSRGARVRAKNMGARKVEIIATPSPGVDEKPYQCENRMGSFESLATLFTNEFAKIEHPLCFHRGDKHCQYIVQWAETRFGRWQRVRNYTILASFVAMAVLYFLLPVPIFLHILLADALLCMGFSLISLKLEKDNLAETLEKQGDIAATQMEGMSIRYNNALLIQETGQATSRFSDVDRLLQEVMKITEKRLDFDRGAIWLVNSDQTRLCFKCGYGYSKEQEQKLQRTQFNLLNKGAKGPLVLALRQQKPILINDMKEKEGVMSPRSVQLARDLEIGSLLSVPIVYEKESLGLLCVDNVHSRRPLMQTDMSLLVGIASQTAVSIINARSFHQVKENERKYRELVENANSIILRIDTAGSINFLNEFAQKLLGYAEEELLGKSVLDTISDTTEETKQAFRKLVSDISLDPEKWIVREEEMHTRGNRKIWITWTYKPIFGQDGKLAEILCIGNDVTELKAAEKARQELAIRLQRAEKMEAIGTLAGGVAHDLNNILAGLVSYPELLLMQLPEGSALEKPLMTIQKSGEKAARIVQDLLTLARRGVPVTEIVDFNSIISEYLESPEFNNLKKHHPLATIETNLEEELLSIKGSPVHLSKTIMNLVSNAAEAMPDGGCIVIGTRNEYIDSTSILSPHLKEGDYVLLTVSDNGIGISRDDLSRIFEPFYTKKVMGRSGTGLGMAVVWGTVQDHGGYIDIRSAEGRGTTFSIYLPATREKPTVTEGEFPIGQYRAMGESILVVDDVAEQREIAVNMLSQLDYQVSAIASGEEAVEYLRKNTVDLVVLDMIMAPGIDGLETFKRIKKINPEQRAIIVSGFSESERVKEAQRLGVGSYVRKPYLLKNIVTAVRFELDSSHP
jgi:PAS domain S-box-containing protein